MRNGAASRESLSPVSDSKKFLQGQWREWDSETTMNFLRNVQADESQKQEMSTVLVREFGTFSVPPDQLLAFLFSNEAWSRVFHWNVSQQQAENFLVYKISQILNQDTLKQTLAVLFRNGYGGALLRKPILIGDMPFDVIMEAVRSATEASGDTNFYTPITEDRLRLALEKKRCFQEKVSETFQNRTFQSFDEVLDVLRERTPEIPTDDYFVGRVKASIRQNAELFGNVFQSPLRVEAVEVVPNIFSPNEYYIRGTIRHEFADITFVYDGSIGLEEVVFHKPVSEGNVSLSALRREPSGMDDFPVGKTVAEWRYRTINGEPIDRWMKNLYPAAVRNPLGTDKTSVVGFLRSGERLVDVLLRDNQMVTNTLHTTHQAIAEPLFACMRAFDATYPPVMGFLTVKKSTVTCEIAGVRYRIAGEKYTSAQGSPFGDSASGHSDFVVTNVDTGEELRFAELLPYLIYQYGFYEGDVPYRIPPEKIQAFFGR